MTANRITKGFAWNHLYKIVEYGGVYLYAVLVIRKFGPELGGSYAVYISISSTLAIVGAFAVDGVLLRYLPRILRGDRAFGDVKIEGIRPFLIELLAFRVFINLILAALLVLVLVVIPHYSSGLMAALGGIRLLWPYIVIYLLGQAIVAFSTFTLIGLLQVKWVFYASLIARSSLLAAGMILLITGTLSLHTAVALHAFSAVATGALLLYWVNRHVERTSSRGLRAEFAAFGTRLAGFMSKPGQVRFFVLLPFMLYGVTTWGSDLLSTVLGQQPDILMMRGLLGENARDTGLYAVASQLALITEYIALFGLGGTLVSVFSELAHEDEQHPLPKEVHLNTVFHYPRLRNARLEIAGFQTVSTGPVFAFMIAFSPLVIEVLYGPKFAGAQPILFLSLIIQALTVVVFGGGMHITSLVAIGKERVVLINRLSWGVLNLLANFFLIQSFGGIGAILGTRIANAGACATESFLTSRWIGQSFRPVRSAIIVLVVAGSAAASYFIIELFPSLLPVVRLSMAGACMAIITLSGYAIFRVPEAQKVFRKLRSLLDRSALG